jgi:pantoate--beta-alanine ligase
MIIPGEKTMNPTAIKPAPLLITDGDDVRQLILHAGLEGQTVGLVPTMGALHQGHLSLVRAAQAECDMTVVSIFVNPAQFGPSEDFRRYPRTLDADLAALAAEGVEVVFAPSLQQIYPDGHATTVEVGGIALPLEGICRPDHFRGVATVVLKLFHLAPAHVAYFGQKDYQQSLVVRQMVRDLNLPIRVRVCPIVRETDGLALSSRNAYLSDPQRETALSLSRSLRLASELYAAGERNTAELRRQMRDLLESANIDDIDYLALADRDSLEQDAMVGDSTIALVAVRVGKTRLIDNHLLADSFPGNPA